MVSSVSEQNFQQAVLKNEKPVVVDFWAEWCGPCRQLAPALESAAAEVPEVYVVKMNIDENMETPTKYGVRGIPTLMAFKGGQPVSTLVGLRSADEIKAWLQSQV